MGKKYLLKLSLSIGLCYLYSVLFTPPPSLHSTADNQTQILFSEVFYDSLNYPENDEFIEIFNPSGNSQQLEGWTIWDNGGAKIIYEFPEQEILPGQYLIISQNFGLNNTGDYLLFKTSSNQTIDAVAWEGGYQNTFPLDWEENFSLQADEGFSISRLCNQSGNQSQDWKSNTIPNPHIIYCPATPTITTTSSSTSSPSKTLTPTSSSTSSPSLTNKKTSTTTFSPTITNTSPYTPNVSKTATYSPSSTSSYTHTKTSTLSPASSSSPTKTVTATLYSHTMSPTNSITINSTATSSPLPTSLDIFLTELLPAPKNEFQYEWIEIYNHENFPIPLANWSLDDFLEGGSSPFVFTTEYQIPARDYLVINLSEETNIKLNNSGDDLYLINPQGKIISSTSYPSAPYDQCWIREKITNHTWQFSSDCTAGEENIYSSSEEDSSSTPTKEKSPVSKTSTPTSPTLTFTPIHVKKAKDKNIDTYINITGLVIAPPHLPRKGMLYLADLYHNTGLGVLLDPEQTYQLEIGEIITVAGKMDTYYHEPILRMATATHLIKKGIRKSPPAPLNSSNIEENLGFLLQITAPLEKIQTPNLYLKIGDQSVQVHLTENSQASWPKEIQKGDQIIIIGLASQYNDRYRILPRYAEDIKTQKDLPQTGMKNIFIYTAIILIGITTKLFIIPISARLKTKHKKGLANE